MLAATQHDIEGTGPVKICILGDKAYYKRILPDNTRLDSPDVVFLGRDATNDEVVAAMPDTQILMADAIATIGADLIDRLPQLRLIQSEGVSYNSFDCACAAERGIFVCNNAGMNSGAVAEQTILLMLGLLRSVATSDAAVRQGRQMDVKMHFMREGITDLADCTVGLVGMGAIGQATAARLRTFGCRVLYANRSRKPAELEETLGIEYAELDELLAESDIVSLHCAVTPETYDMADEDFLAKMCQGSYLVNTARGQLVNNEALAQALESGHLAGAGLDTVHPEPVELSNPLLQLSPQASRRVLFSPHLGGITTGSMRRGQAHMWDNVARLEAGERPTCIVNGL